MSFLISVPEAAARLGIPRNRCYTWCRRGILPHARDGGRIYVPVQALERLIQTIEAGQWPENSGGPLRQAGLR